MKKLFFCLTLILLVPSVLFGQNSTPENRAKLEKKLNAFFENYKAQDTKLERAPRMLKCVINDSTRTLTITADEVFAQQDFSPKIVEKIYNKIQKTVPEPYDTYNTTIYTNGLTLNELIPNRLTDNVDKSRLWGSIDYKGAPWVKNVSKPNDITHGLQNRHLCLWASHGRYYDNGKGMWKWQRPNLFGTTEDLFTQTIVVPYLMPMLENAGAIIFTPRERDWQKLEYIVDNDATNQAPFYTETTQEHSWKTTNQTGFAMHSGSYADCENPFLQGTARMTETTSSDKRNSTVSYQPKFEKSGRYAVYVSYQTLENSIDDAEYIIYHQGQQTTFKVNQKMGGGTWVYLGSFYFDEGCNIYNRVVLTNHSKHSGVVTTDAIRFGGGMGNIVRGGSTSGFPRCLEAARYYTQWAGAPKEIVCYSEGTSDYKDDLNSRSLMLNWIAGGSCFVPNSQGKQVPIELSLAVHSDAGVDRSDGIVGTLSICTTKDDENNTKLNSGISRMASRDFADALLSGVYRDVRYKYKYWTRRSLFDQNYNETRRPAIPSAILETLSHQNFTDMRYGLDPNFRFTMARSIYKTILRYVCDQHGISFVVQPLQPNNFRIEFSSKNKVTLKWDAVNDPQESTAKATSYNVYMATGTSGFDNGTNVKSSSYTIELTPGVPYHFRVTACNRGGESFPTEVLTAVRQPKSKKTVLIVNGFHRVASPLVINNATQQGFDLKRDPGITYGPMAGWVGYQQCFTKSQRGKEGPGALGFSGDELAGKFIAGNDFNYVMTHAEAILSAQRYNIVSCSSEAVESGKVNLNKYHCVDLLLGLEKNDGHSLVNYKTFSPTMCQKLTNYTRSNGRIFVSGSYVGADMTESNEQNFLANIFKIRYNGNNYNCNNNIINGLGTSFKFYKNINEEHYAATEPDILQPVQPAYCAMQYGNGKNAAVAYSGNDYRCFTMGFPFECITDAETRASIMRGILSFLME